MLVRVTLPQLVTSAVTRLAWPMVTVLQVLLTAMQGFSVTTHVLFAVAETGVPHMLRPVAVTVSGKLPHVFVTDFVRVADPPGAGEDTSATAPSKVFVTWMLVR